MVDCMTSKPLRKRVVSAAAVAFLAFGAVGASSPALAAGSSEQTRNGLTCENRWWNTLGRTDCSGTTSKSQNQEWKMRIACQFQPDPDRHWMKGNGSDAFECTFGVQSVHVEWR